MEDEWMTHWQTIQKAPYTWPPWDEPHPNWCTDSGPSMNSMRGTHIRLTPENYRVHPRPHSRPWTALRSHTWPDFSWWCGRRSSNPHRRWRIGGIVFGGLGAGIGSRRCVRSSVCLRLRHNKCRLGHLRGKGIGPGGSLWWGGLGPQCIWHFLVTMPVNLQYKYIWIS